MELKYLKILWVFIIICLLLSILVTRLVCIIYLISSDSWQWYQKSNLSKIVKKNVRKFMDWMCFIFGKWNNSIRQSKENTTLMPLLKNKNLNSLNHKISLKREYAILSSSGQKISSMSFICSVQLKTNLKKDHKYFSVMGDFLTNYYWCAMELPLNITNMTICLSKSIYQIK